MFNNPLSRASIWRISEFEFQCSTAANVMRRRAHFFLMDKIQWGHVFARRCLLKVHGNELRFIRSVLQGCKESTFHDFFSLQPNLFFAFLPSSLKNTCLSNSSIDIIFLKTDSKFNIRSKSREICSILIKLHRAILLLIFFVNNNKEERD